MHKVDNTRLRVVFLFAAISLVALSVASYVKINNLIGSSASVRHSHQVKLEVENTLSTLTKMESNERGYLLTKDTAFLVSYSQASAELDGHLTEIDSLVNNNLTVLYDATILRTLIYNRLYSIQDILTDYRLGIPIAPERLEQKLLKGKVQMDEIRRHIDKIKAAEDQRLLEYSSALSRNIVMTPFFLAFLSLASIVILVASYFKIIQELKLAYALRTEVASGESRIQAILQYAPDAVITLNENGTIMSWNPRAEEIFGWKENEVLGKPLTETIIPKDMREKHIDGIKNFVKTGKSTLMNKPVEMFAITKDNQSIPVEIKISSSRPNDHHMFIGFVRDIAQRKQVEESLKNRTSQLIEAQRLAHIGSWEWDVHANHIDWSDELYRIFGLTPQEFEPNYESYLSYIHPEDRDYVDGIIKQAFKDLQPFNFFNKIIRPDSVVRIVSATGNVTTNHKGEVIRMSGTAQDVTEQKQYEVELVRSKERFLKIFDKNPIAMTLAEIKTNKIAFANNLFYSQFGYSEAEVIGHTTEELKLISPEENERLVALIMDYLKEERSVEELRTLSLEETEELLLKLKEANVLKNFEILYTRKNGETFFALVSYEIVGIGNQRYTITSYQDITERKKISIQLEKQNEELAKMNKELESFNYISSHDLQEPLRKIQIIANRLSTTELQNLSNSGKDYFNRLEQSAHRMQTLIKDLLAYSRMSTADRKFEHTDLRLLVEEVKLEFHETIKEKQAVIESDDMCSCSVIPFQFHQLLTNLISNALKFSRPEIPPHIILKCRIVNGKKLNYPGLNPGQNYCHLTVSDNGVGFDPEYSEKIFEVFQRVHGRDKYVGTGIGLAIVKKIVENHDGIITATGQLNKGATFDIYIPENRNA
jgi:PAS domain S-box-containing protein